MVLGPHPFPQQPATAERVRGKLPASSPIRQHARLFAIQWVAAAFCRRSFTKFPYYSFASPLLRAFFFERRWRRLLCGIKVLQ